MGSFDISIAQKVAVAVALPVASFLLYFLLKKSNEEEEELSQRVVTSRQTLIEVKVPRSAAGSIIGPRGARIKEVQESTGARIQFKDDMGSDSTERTVVIRGQVEAAQRAEMIIRHMVSEIPPIVKDSLNVPERAIGRIIGRGGETIRSLCRSSKCKINVPQEQKLGGIQRIILEGSPTAISTAKALIEEKVHEEEAFRARIAVNASNRQERGPRRREGGTENTHQEATALLQAEGDSWVAQPKSEPAQTDDVVDSTPSPTTIAPEAAKWTNHRDYLEVYVSAVEHPGHFWVQVISSKATKLDDLSQDMTRFYSHMNEGEAATVGEIQEGDLLAAPFPFDDQWYRVRVTEVEDDKVDAYYVDFGDSYWVEKSKLKSLRSDFLSLPFQAIEVCLANVKPSGDTWSEDANILFEELTHMAKWKVVNARTVSYIKTDDGESMPCLELIDTNGAKDINVAKVLMERGYAVYVQEKEAVTSSDVSSNTQIDDSITYEEIAPERDNKLMSSVDPPSSSPSYCRKRTPHRNSRQLVVSSEEKQYLFAEKDPIDIVNRQSDVHHNVFIDISTIVEKKVPFDETSPCVHVEPFDQRLLQATFLEDDFVSDLDVFYDAKGDQVKESCECELKAYHPSDINEHATVKMEEMNDFSEGEIGLNSDELEGDDNPTVLLETSIQLIQTQHENSENRTVQNKNEFLVSETKDMLAIRPKTLDVDTQEDISVKQPQHSANMAAKQLYPSSLSSTKEYHTGLSESCHTTAEQKVSFDDTCDVTDSSTCNMKGVLSDVCVEVPQVVNIGIKYDEYAPESVSAVHNCSQKPTNSCVSTDRRDICLNTVDESINTGCIYENKEDISKKSDFGNVFSFDESHVDSDINTQGSLCDPCDNFSTRSAEGTEASAKVGCEVREPSSAADYNNVFGSDQLMPFDECSSHSKTADCQTDQMSSTAPIQSPISYYDKKRVESEVTNVQKGISERKKVGNFDFQLNSSVCSPENMHVSSHAVGGSSSPRPLDIADHPMLNSNSLLVLGRQCEDEDEESLGQLLEEMCPIQDKPKDGTMIDKSLPIASTENDKSDIAFSREARSVDCSDDNEHTSTDDMSTETAEIPVPNPNTCLSQDEEQNLSIFDMSEICPPQDTDLSRAKLSPIPVYETQYVKELISPQADRSHCSNETHLSEIFVGRQFALVEKETDILVENQGVDAFTPEDTDIARAEPSSVSVYKILHVKEEEVIPQQLHSSHCSDQTRDPSVNRESDGPKDVNYEENNTLMAPSSELQIIHLKVDDVLVPEIQHQEHEIPSSSAETFDMPFQDKHDAQSDGVCSPENPSVGRLPGDLTSSFEIKTEESDIAFTREVQEVDFSDDIVNSSVNALCIETFEVPIFDTTACLNQEEKQDLSIPDINEACTPELSRDEQTSIPEYEIQQGKEQVISSQQDDSDNCSDQIPVPLEHLAPSYEDSDHLSESLVEKETCMSVEKDVERLDRESSETDITVQCPNEELKDVNCEQDNTRMMLSSESQNVDLEKTEVLLPQIHDQHPEIPASFVGSSKIPLQDQQDTQLDVFFCTESPSDGTLHQDLVLSPSFEVKTEQSGVAFTREVLAVDCTDYSEHSSVAGMSTETSEVPICDTTMHVSQDEEQTLSITPIREAYMPEDTSLSRAEQSSFPEGETQYANEEQLILSQQVDSEHCPDQTHLSDICVDRQFALVEKETEILIESLDLEACTPGSTDFARAEQSSGPLYKTQHVTEEQVKSPQVDGKYCSDQTTGPMDNLASYFDDKDSLSESSLNRQLAMLDKDTDILGANTDAKLLDRENKETDIPVECSHEGPNDVNCEQNIVTLFTSSSESQIMHLKQTEVLVPGIQHQEAEILSSYAESFNVPVQNQNDVQTDGVCSTENPSVGTLHEDLVLSPSMEVQTEQSGIAFTREVMTKDCSDDIVHSSADAMSTETCVIPISSTTTCLDQDEEHSMSITDTSGSCTPEDTDPGRVKQSSIPVYESQHVKEQQVISSPHVNSEPCSNQSHLTESCMNSQLPLVEKDTDMLVENAGYELQDKGSTETNITVECLNKELNDVNYECNTLMTSSSVSQNMDIEQDEVLLPGMQHPHPEIPSSSPKLSNMSLQDHHDEQSDVSCSVGTLDDVSVLSSSSEVQTEQSHIALPKETMAVDCSDTTVHSSAEAMSIESSEMPLCDTTTHFSQGEEHSLSITDTRESCAPEDCASAEQISIPVYESQHATEQVLSSQEVSSENCTHLTPVPLSPSSKQRDHLSKANVNRQFTLAEKDTDIVLENQDYELLDKVITEANIPVECLNEELKDVNCERNTLMTSSPESQNMDREQNEVLVPGMQHQQCEIPASSAESSKTSLQDQQDTQPDATCCTEDPSVGILDDDSDLSSHFEVQTEESHIAITREVMAADCSDTTVHSSAEAMSIESSEFPLCDTTTHFSQDEEHSLSITDTSDCVSAEQISIPVYESQHATEQVVSSQEVNSEHCSHQTPVPLASSSGERDHLSEANVNRQFTLAEKDTDIVHENPDYELLDRDITKTIIPVECSDEELKDVNCECNTLMTSSTVSQNMDVEQNEVLLLEMQYQQCEIPSSSAESSNMSLQDHRDAQSEAACCTEDPSVGTLDNDSDLSSSFEVQTEQSHTALPKETMAVDCSDTTVHSSAEAMSIESSEFPLCDTTTHFSQEEEHSLSITDTRESCAPEDFACAEQISIPVYERQHATEQVLASQEVSSENCTHQTPVPLSSSSEQRDHLSKANVNRQFPLAEKDTDIVLENQDYELLDKVITEANIPVECLNEELKDVNCERNTLMTSSPESQNMDIEQNKALVPGMQYQQCEIPASSAKSSKTSLQDQQDTQPDAACCTEDPSVGTLDNDSDLSSRFEVQTEQSHIAIIREVMAADCSDATGHSSAESMSIESSEIPLCDTTTHFSQEEEHSLSITDTSDCVSAEQISIPVYESQHATEQVLSSQEIDNEHCSHKTPVPLASSSEESDHWCKANVNRQLTLAEKDTDIVLENSNYDLLDKVITETNIPVERLNEELTDVNCEHNTLMTSSCVPQNMDIEQNEVLLPGIQHQQPEIPASFAESSSMSFVSLEDQQDTQPGDVCCTENPSVGTLDDDSVLSSGFEIQTEQFDSAFTREVMAVDCTNGSLHSSADAMSTETFETPIIDTSTCLDKDEEHSLSITDTSESCAPEYSASAEQGQYKKEQPVSSQEVDNEHCSHLSSNFQVQADQTDILPEAVEPEHLDREDKEIGHSLIPATPELKDPESEHFEDCPTLMVREEHDLQFAQHQRVPELLPAELKKVPQAVYSPPKELNTPSHVEPGDVDLHKLVSIETRCSLESLNRALEDVYRDQTERPLQTANMETHETSLDEPIVLEVQEERAEQMEYPLQFSSDAEINDKDEPEHPSTKQCVAYAQKENLSMSNEGLSEVIRSPIEASIRQLQDTQPGLIQSPTAELHEVQTYGTEFNDASVLDDTQGAFETSSSQIHDIEGGQEEMSDEISVVRTDDNDSSECHHKIVVHSSELQEQTAGLSLQQQKGKANIGLSSADTKRDAVPLDLSEKEETEFCEICGIPVDTGEGLITACGQIDGPTEMISSSEHKSCLQEMQKSGNNLQSSVTESIQSIEPLLSHHEENTSNDHHENRCDSKKSEEVTESEINIDNTAAGNKGITFYSKTPDKHSPESEDRSCMGSENRISAEPIHQVSDSYGGEMYQQKACDDSEHVEVTLCSTWDPEHQVIEMEEKYEADVKIVQQNVDSEESLEDSMSERTVVSLSFGSEVTSGQQSTGIGHKQSEGEQRTHDDGKTLTVTRAAYMEVEELLVGDNMEQAPDIPGSVGELVEHQVKQMEGEIENLSELNHHEIYEQQVVANLQTQLPMTTENTEEDLTEVDRFQKSTNQMSEMGHSQYFDTIEHMCTEHTCRSPDVDSAYESPTRPTYLHASSITGKTVIDTEETNLLLDDINQNSECVIISSLGESLLQKDKPENLQPDIAGIVNDEYTTLISSVDRSKEELPRDCSGEDRRNQTEVELSMDDNKREITKDNHRHQEEGVDDQLEESNCSGDEDAPNQMPSLMGMKMYKDLPEVITSDGSESVDSGLQLQDHLPSDDSKHDAIKEWLMVQASPVLDTSSSVWSDGSNTSSCRELIDACQGEECLEIDVPCCMEVSVDEGQDMGKFPHTESFILNPSAGDCGAFNSLYKSDKFPTEDKNGEFASFRLHSSMEEEESRNPELVSSNYDERKLTAALKGCQGSLSDAVFKIEPSYADATARKEVSDRLVGHLAPQYAPSFRRCSSTGDIETEREMEYSTLASWSEDEYTGGRRRYAYDDQYGVEYDDDSSSMDSLEEQTYPAASAMRHRSPSRGYTTSGAAGQPRQCSRGETRHCSLYDEFQDMLEEFYGHASLVSVESATATTSTSYASALEDLPSDDVEQVMTDSLEELTAEDIGATYPDILYPPSSRSSISQDSLNDIDDISSTNGGGEEICETNSSFTDDSIEDAYDTDEGGPRVIYGTELEQTLFDANITPTVEFAAPFPASPTTPTASQGSKDSESLLYTEQSPCLPPGSGKYVS